MSLRTAAARAAAAVAAFVLVYLMAGFVAWNLDASTWSTFGRIYVVIVGLGAAFIAATFPEGGPA